MEADRLRDSKVVNPIKVILDSNFLMIPWELKIDIFDELNRVILGKYEILIPTKVIEELEKLLKKGSLRERKAAVIGLNISKGLKRIDAKGDHTDEAILSIVDKNTVVCTNDKVLRKRVIAKGGRTVFLRQKKRLELEGGLIEIS